MELGELFLQLSMFLAMGLAGGVIALKLGQPIILGELSAGALLGFVFVRFFPSHVFHSATLDVLSEIGICALLFDVGLEMNLKRIRSIGFTALAVAAIGVFIPFFLGYLTAYFWGLPQKVSMLIAASLTATSVGVTAAVLKETKQETSRVGNIILGAAVIDDILGLVVLTLITGVVGDQTLSASSLLRISMTIVLFLSIALFLLRPLASKILDFFERTYGAKGVTLASFSFLLFLSYIAETIGLAFIIGAFIAGLALSETHERDEIYGAFKPIINIFAGLFFVLMGTQIDFALLNPVSAGNGSNLLLSTLLVVSAIVGKLVCGFAVLGDLKNKWTVGIGMIPRGEVGLIYGNLGRARGIFHSEHLSMIVFMVIITTFLGSSLLKWRMKRHKTD